MWRDLGGRLGGFAKVKAHLAREEAVGRRQVPSWHDNDRADRLAKGRALSISHPADDRAAVDDFVDGLSAFLRAVARQLSHYLPCRELVIARASELAAAVMGRLIVHRAHRLVLCEHLGVHVCLQRLRSARLEGV